MRFFSEEKLPTRKEEKAHKATAAGELLTFLFSPSFFNLSFFPLASTYCLAIPRKMVHVRMGERDGRLTIDRDSGFGLVVLVGDLPDIEGLFGGVW